MDHRGTEGSGQLTGDGDGDNGRMSHDSNDGWTTPWPPVAGATKLLTVRVPMVLSFRGNTRNKTPHYFAMLPVLTGKLRDIHMQQTYETELSSQPLVVNSNGNINTIVEGEDKLMENGDDVQGYFNTLEGQDPNCTCSSAGVTDICGNCELYKKLYRHVIGASATLCGTTRYQEEG